MIASASQSNTPEQSRIRVLIADDQDTVRTAFRFFLGSQPDIDVVAEAADGLTAVREIQRTQPDVCLVDIRMPGFDGIEVTRRVTGSAVTVRTRVVIVTTFDHDEYVLGALDAGATGFLLKDSGPQLLIEAIRAAHVGDALISPSITVRLLEWAAQNRKLTVTRAAQVPLVDDLTARESDVVIRLARGLTNQEIAEDLFVTLSTVKSHLASVQNKLGARNRVEIASWAWRNGLADN